MMKRINKIFGVVAMVLLTLLYNACRIPDLTSREPRTGLLPAYGSHTDTVNSAKFTWKQFYTDPYLASLVDQALENNQELNIMEQEIEVVKSEVRARKGEILPSAGIRAGAGFDKVGRFTNIGALEATTDIEPGHEMPEPLTDAYTTIYAIWEVDIWRKLRNARQSALNRYLASTEGRNFMLTNLISELAEAYYELLALDRQLEIVRQNIGLQSNALEIVKVQKQAARVTELAVQRFQAQLLKTQGLQFDLQQKTVEAENRINFLVGRHPQPVQRSAANFDELAVAKVLEGIPAQLLENRPDVRQAELELAASKLDVQVARAAFLPGLGITAGIGVQAFKPSYLIKPESLLYNLAGDIAAPLVNRNAIKAAYSGASAKQMQAVYNLEKVLLSAEIEVVNQLSRVSNLENAYKYRSARADALSQSIDISNQLFRATRADYLEVLLTQQEALDSRFELVETKMQQFQALIGLYRSLGGGWR